MAGSTPDEPRAALAADDHAAFAELYDRLGARLYRAALRITGDHADAEDAVQDTFIALVRHRHHLAAARDLEAYVFTVLRHAALKRRPRRAAPLALATDITAPSAPQHDDELARAVQQLPSTQREAIALKIDGQLTFAQIGQAMDVSMNTAASRYREGIRKLRDLLEGRWGDHGAGGHASPAPLPQVGARPGEGVERHDSSPLGVSASPQPSPLKGEGAMGASLGSDHDQ